MRIKAKVISVDGSYATVQCDRRSACDGCHKNADGSDCSVCTLMGGNRSVQSRAHNACCARPGDIVEVETASSRVLAYAAIVFLLPIVLSMLGYFLSGIWFEELRYRLLCSAAALVFTFVGIRIYSEFILKKKTDITVVRIVTQDDLAGE